MAGSKIVTKEQLKQAVCEAIDRHGNQIIELGETILHHPETGFNEGRPPRRSPRRCARSASTRRPALR